MALRGRATDLWFAEQLEAIAIAVAMALVLKFFVIEAYQIPTGSMQPTILGDAGTGIKDRVLADKLSTLLRDPRRWEVMIFRFPHDERRLYVKRIVGLPGETLEVLGGDVWIDGKIARKPDHVNDSVLKDIFKDAGGIADIGRYFRAGPGVTIDGNSASFAADVPGQLELKRAVVADYLHGYDPDWGIKTQSGGPEAVPDLDAAFTARLQDGARELSVTLVSDEGNLVLSLPVEGSPADTPLVALHPLDGGPSLVLAEADGHRLPTDESVEIVARNVDRQLVLWVDGEEWVRIADDSSGPRRPMPIRARVRIGIEGGGRVSDVVVRRDIFYLPRAPDPRWEIPDDSYFALGDNTQGSLDSRNWETKTYVLEDREITGFWFPAPVIGPAPPDHNPKRGDDGSYIFADTHGDEFSFHPDEVLSERREPGPFIHRRYMLGKAMAVFWPIYDPFRWKLIR